jgi:hypothetical protein
MTSPSAASAPLPDALSRFDSLNDMQTEHSGLAKAVGTDVLAADHTDRIVRFVRRGVATGAVLEAREDRAAAQSLINFWTSRLTSAAHETIRSDDTASEDSRNLRAATAVGDTLLEEFDPATLRSAARNAENWLNSLAEADKTTVRRMMLRLVRLARDGKTIEVVPATRAALRDVASSAGAADDFIEKLVGAGVLRVGRGDSRDVDLITLRSADLASEWRAFASWIDHRKQDRMLAERWNAHGRPSSLLLEYEALEEARGYHDRTAVESDFVRASSEQEIFWSRTNRYLKWVWGLLLLVASVALAIAIAAYRHQSRLQQELAAKNSQLESAQNDLREENRLKDENIREKNSLIVQKDSLIKQLSTKTYNELQTQAENFKLRKEVVSQALARDPTLKGQWRLWQNGSTLIVQFLDGDKELHELVKQHAPEWSQYANLKFEFTGRPVGAPIRLTFKAPGSWSAVGSEALTVPAGNPTMNLGMIRGMAPEDAARVIRHEFGHVLGLIHEQQSPNADIKWNKEKVLAVYSGPPNNWSTHLIEEYFFHKYPPFKDPEYRPFDPKSIMMWPIDPGLADITVGVNQDLSASDKQFAAQLYPGISPTK